MHTNETRWVVEHDEDGRPINLYRICDRDGEVWGEVYYKRKWSKSTAALEYLQEPPTLGEFVDEAAALRIAAQLDARGELDQADDDETHNEHVPTGAEAASRPSPR